MMKYVIFFLSLMLIFNKVSATECDAETDQLIFQNYKFRVSNIDNADIKNIIGDYDGKNSDALIYCSYLHVSYGGDVKTSSFILSSDEIKLTLSLRSYGKADIEITSKVRYRDGDQRSNPKLIIKYQDGMIEYFKNTLWTKVNSGAFFVTKRNAASFYPFNHVKVFVIDSSNQGALMAVDVEFPSSCLWCKDCTPDLCQ